MCDEPRPTVHFTQDTVCSRVVGSMRYGRVSLARQCVRPTEAKLCLWTKCANPKNIMVWKTRLNAETNLRPSGPAPRDAYRLAGLGSVPGARCAGVILTKVQFSSGPRRLSPTYAPPPALVRQRRSHERPETIRIERMKVLSLHRGCRYTAIPHDRFRCRSFRIRALAEQRRGDLTKGRARTVQH